MGSGYFIQVKPGTHKDGSNLPDTDDVIQNPSKGVMNVVGKPAGVYEYIFVSTDDGFCGMARGEQSVVRVYLVPQLTGFPVLTNVCPGTEEDINFNDFITPETKYFLDEMGWTVSYYTLEGNKVEMPVKAGLRNVGNNVYRYSINDGSGAFVNKYSDMKNTSYYCPEDSAFLTHTVRIRENEEYVIPDRSISFCTDVLSLVPETEMYLNTNLFGYLGSSAPNGRWSVKYSPLTGVDEVTIDETSGDVTIYVAMMAFLNDSIVFKYSYKDCMDHDTSTLLTFNFDKAKFKKVFDNKTQSVCRNLMSGMVELSSVFGFTVPLTSGIWYQEVTNDFEEMLYGKVDISEMRTGSPYKFRYDVNSAIDAACLAEVQSTTFELKVYDIAVANAELKICKDQFASGMTIDLSRYVPSLNDTTRISPSMVTWKDSTGRTILNPGSYTLRASEEWQTSEFSVYKMLYQYEVRSACGLYTGNLHISTVDSLSLDTIRNITICYTDDYAKYVDLFQILGIAVDNNPDGYFELESAMDNNKQEITLSDEVLDNIKQNGKLNAFDLFNTDHESETYTFGYLPYANGGSSCVSNDMKVTITVTRDIKEDSKFDK
jgi:hypothetical protein